MKKVIIAILLVAAICVPAFAKSSALVGGGVSASLSFDNGVKFNGVEVFADAKYVMNDASTVDVEGKLGYLFSFDQDPAVSGVYVDVTADYVSDSKLYVKGGVCADFHVIDGSLKANAGLVAGAELTVVKGSVSSSTLYVAPAVEVSYSLINTTGAPAFNLDAGVVVNM